MSKSALFFVHMTCDRMHNKGKRGSSPIDRIVGNLQSDSMDLLSSLDLNETQYFSVIDPLSPSFSQSLCLSICLSHTRTYSPPLYIFVYLSRSVSVSVSVSISVTVIVSVSVPSLSLPLYLLSLNHSL